MTATTPAKTIVTQNPAGIFKPISTGAGGGAVALKAGPAAARAPAGRLAVSLAPPPPHIQVPLVPGAAGPPRPGRLAVPAQALTKLAVAPAPQPRTIQLPYSGAGGGAAGQAGQAAKPGPAPIPVARVVPQQSQQAAREPGPAGYVVAGTFLGAGQSQGQQGQTGPVNLTVSDRSAFSRAAVAPAMSLPNFAQTTFLYEPGQQSSVTITTLPASEGGAGAGQQPGGQSSHGPATITPARITPILPAGGAGGDQERTVPGSPRPSILRKRPDGDNTPVKGTALLTSPPRSPARPESSNSSTISATSSLPGLSGDEAGPGVAAASHPHPAPLQTPAILEPSPRKKPRKQQLPPRESGPNISPEWAAVKRELGARERLEWNTRPEPDWEGRVRNWNRSWQGGNQEWDQDTNQDQADDEEEMSTDEERDKSSNFIQVQ